MASFRTDDLEVVEHEPRLLPRHPHTITKRSSSSVSTTRLLRRGDSELAIQRSKSQKNRYALGVVLVLIVVVLWVSSNFLTAALFYDDSYSKPYFVTYVNTATFSFYLLPEAFSYLRSLIRPSQQTYTPLPTADETAPPKQPPLSRATPASDDEEPPLTLRETFSLSAQFCIIWFIANYFSGACFLFTSVPSGTILSSTSSIFTLFLGVYLRIEKFTNLKFSAVLISILGIIIVSSIDIDTPSVVSPSIAGRDEQTVGISGGTLPKTPTQIFLGDTLAILGALSYAFYTTLLKYRVRSESRLPTRHFFGFVGLINLLLLWPGLVFLHVTGLEPFELPSTKSIWIILGINAGITFTSDICWAVGMLLTSPVLATVGLGLTIPLAMLGDHLLGKGSPVGGWYWIGAAAVGVGFLLVNWEEGKESGEAVFADEGGRVD
ncbi:hypothetical protein BJ508DRAFT_206294 [Ascobolus immersus RN42]|uniref:EamA domain-containing protein n=1 Tax=Ascobolus immersus RN42 TaxID=1160509 RepID=A0A3N4IDW1_ASCIM|nr:hypothetical protein BJ508DRAFT_206294 [Ascobolus immersus RN42]